MDLYGKLNNEIELKEYKAGKTATSDVNINSNVITADVKKVPNKLVVNYNGASYEFDGSSNVELNLNQYYGINANISNGKYVGMYSMRPGDIIGALIIANEGYNLPEQISVENANLRYYNRETGEVIFDSPNNTVILTVNCI